MKPHVFLCMPSYDGWVREEASAAFHRDWPGIGVTPATPNGGCSLLPLQFNLFWLGCVVYMDRCGYTHFAMQHADVAPEADWLPIMLREMDAHQATVISAVIPEKNWTGRTSTATELYNEQKRKREIRRLTVEECQYAPTTFTGRDFGFERGGLLLNTGLMLVSLADRSWLKMTPFNITTHIDWESVPPIVRTESEDWHFSRQLNDLGKKLCATTAVKVRHLGNASYSNFEVSDYNNDRDPWSPVISLLDNE